MWRELFCQISIQYSPTYGPVFRGDQIDVDLINKSFPVTVTEKWNILVGLTRNNRGNDQGTRGTFHRAFCANIRTLFLDIFCLIFPSFSFSFHSYLFLPVTKRLLRAISLHFVKMRDHCSQYGIQPRPQGFSLKKWEAWYGIWILRVDRWLLSNRNELSRKRGKVSRPCCPRLWC